MIVIGGVLLLLVLVLPPFLGLPSSSWLVSS
jgi:hypothetical protein